MEYKRRFSLEKDFMNFKTNDLLYGFMRGLSTASPEGNGKWREYLPIKTFKQNKKLIAGICDCSTRTIERHIDALFEAGLLDEGVEIVESKGKRYEYPCYWFPYKENGKHKLIDQELVKYLVNTRNSQAIRIYLYLLNKYQWKKDYVFTQEEIRDALGYAPSTTSCMSLIRDCLSSFKAEGLIDFTVEKMPIEANDGSCRVTHTYRMVLKYVCTSSSGLPTRNFK